MNNLAAHLPVSVGHRGWPALFPANTLAGFQSAWQAGCAMVECDVRIALDGVPVLAHDDYVIDRDGDRHSIPACTSAHLASLDLGAGQGVPTLQQLVDWASCGCAVMADFKIEGDGAETKTAEILSALPPGQKLVPGASAYSRKILRQVDPHLPISLSLGRERANELAGDGFDRLLESLDTDAVTWQFHLLSASRVDALQERGVVVYAWTVDDDAAIKHMIEIGVNGIISNRVDRLVSHLHLQPR